jgi:hypothetical protein
MNQSKALDRIEVSSQMDECQNSQLSSCMVIGWQDHRQLAHCILQLIFMYFPDFCTQLLTSVFFMCDTRMQSTKHKDASH